MSKLVKYVDVCIANEEYRIHIVDRVGGGDSFAVAGKLDTDDLKYI